MLASASCADGAPERAWIHLAAGFAPRAQAAEPAPWEVASPQPLEIAGLPAEAGVLVRTVLGRADWAPAGLAGVWRARAPMPGVGQPASGAPAYALTAAAPPARGFDFLAEPSVLELRDPTRIPPGSFTSVGHELFLALGPDEAPPERAELAVYVARGAAEDGRWRVALGRYTADGIPVLSGHAETLEVDVPRASVLRFATAGLASDAGAPTTFRIALDGAPLFATARTLGPDASCEWHAVELPAGPARLELAVDGPAAVTAFLAPRIAPRDVGAYARRPYERRPDVVLFLADTFRADNLGTYGDERGLTPHTDAFAAESAVFERAWAPSSWTLPSQASMMSALHPHQHSAISRGKRLPARLVTLAERMRDAGYRTGAVTDGAFVSRTYGLDQGFEWFDESWTTLDDTLARARAFLDADDGRPVFLFVQTYRTHTPYHVSPETMEAHGERLGIPAAPYEEIARRANTSYREWTAGDPVPAGLAALGEEQRALYLGGVIDLDRGFGEILADLAERGLDETGYVVFTSDHGEAFLEHAHMGHGVGVWEEFVRIPLLLRGPGVAPRRIAESATLLDLPRTLTALAGVPPDPAWLGRPLMAPGTDRPVFAFECRMIDGPPSAVALIDGERKVIAESSPDALRSARIRAAFDLARDPAEREDAADAPWVRATLAELAPLAVELYRPVIEAEEALLQAEQARELDRLGY